ncbi:TonB-dependent receptor [Flavobacterium dankookense]|nr:TonB-dependent receptor [Flavobacterium dankookense]
MKKLVISTLFVLQIVFVFAQSTGFSGKVIDSKTQKPLQNVVASIQNTSITSLSDATGAFIFNDLTPGSQMVLFRSNGYKDQLLVIEVQEGKVLDLGVIVLEVDLTIEQQINLITILENDLGDDNSGSENTAGLLQASRDAYQQTAAFNWGQARFRIRGLDNEYGNTMLNGVSMNKLLDNRPQWGNWGGLNDATRNQEFTMGSAPSDYTFGGILGTQEINTRASGYRKGTRISFAGTNTNYNWRAMATHASGMDKDGWAYMISASRRWAEEAYFEGTDYSANSFFASVEKKINEKHSINFTSIYAQNRRGRNSSNTDEINSIAGINYNSFWGWQDGKKRNSRDREVEEPIFMLTHYWKLSDKTRLTTNLMHQTGSIGNTRIDFLNAPDPNPTYYRNLPSYFTSLYENEPSLVPISAYQPGGLGGVPNPDLLGAISAPFLTNRQIDWAAMYKANTSLVGYDAQGNEIRTAATSKYILYQDRTDDKLYTANTILSSNLSDNIIMNAGASYSRLKSENFQYLTDLLGGTSFLDVDPFQTGSASQPDLNSQNREVKEGDRFGYNYNLFAEHIDVFTQFKFTYKKIDFYLAQSFNRKTYQREGLYQNGIYATTSLGRSEKIDFDNFGFKGGMTYKISGKHFLTFNSLYMSKAPSMRNVFFNARLSNTPVRNIDSETVSNLDLSYVIKTPSFKARLTGFYANIKDATETSFFFAEGAFEDSDGDGGDAFVAEIVTGLDKLNIGAELGLEYQITSTIKATAALSYGEYIYNSNPNVFLNDDTRAANGLSTIVNLGESKLKNYKQPGMPQQAYGFGLEYRDPKFWWVGANINHLSETYLDVSSVLRTQSFVRNPASVLGSPFPEITQERVDAILKQEKFDPYTLLNLTGGKSWRVPGKSPVTIGIFATINNLLDVRYKTGGFEQARNANFRELNQDLASGTPAFAPRYFYGFGRTYFFNFYINL